MALPVDGSADSDLSVKGLTTEELTSGPDREELQDNPDGKLMRRRVRMKACTCSLLLLYFNIRMQPEGYGVVIYIIGY